MCMGVLISFIIFVFGNFSAPDCTVAPFRTWTLVQGIYYLVNIIFSYAYYKHLCATGRENTKFLLFNCFLNVLHTGWLIYGNFLFWPNYNLCANEL